MKQPNQNTRWKLTGAVAVGSGALLGINDMFKLFKAPKPKSEIQKLMESKTDDELREIIRTERKKIVQQLQIIHEVERRLHEVKFHAREGNAEQLEVMLDKGWANIMDFVCAI